jgi:hypothetical protein
MTLKQAYELGKEKGFGIGESLMVDGDPELDAIETQDQLVTVGLDCEEHARCFAPFDGTVRDFNNSRNPDRTWEEYERGVAVGLRKAWRQYR